MDKDKMSKKELMEHAKLLISNAVANLQDVGLCDAKFSLIVDKLNRLFETGFEKPDFLVRLGFFLVEVGLYPGRYQAKID